MIRTAALAAAAAAVIALVLLWVLTIPEVVPASALPPHTPDLDNGKVMFDIGGCASCHATPNADSAKIVRTRARRRACSAIAVRHFLRAEHFAGR